MGGHPYVDNACAHNEHPDCTGRCPYCSDRCVCGCHRAAHPARPDVEVPPRAAEATAAMPAVR